MSEIWGKNQTKKSECEKNWNILQMVLWKLFLFIFETEGFFMGLTGQRDEQAWSGFTRVNLSGIHTKAFSRLYNFLKARVGSKNWKIPLLRWNKAVV